MMNTGTFASAWLPHHGVENHEFTDTSPYGDPARQHRRARGHYRKAVVPTRRPGAGHLCRTGDWLNSRWRS